MTIPDAPWESGGESEQAQPDWDSPEYAGQHRGRGRHRYAGGQEQRPLAEGATQVPGRHRADSWRD